MSNNKIKLIKQAPIHYSIAHYAPVNWGRAGQGRAGNSGENVTGFYLCIVPAVPAFGFRRKQRGL